MVGLFAVLGVMLVLATGCTCGIPVLAAGSDGSGGAVAFFVVAALVAMTVVGVPMGLLVAATARRSGYIEGPYLSIRGLRTRTVDLRQAVAVSLSSLPLTDGHGHSTGRRTPLLTVADTSGTQVKVPLRIPGNGGLLPPHEMLALAAALDPVPAPGAAQAAAWLRRTAHNPDHLLL